MKIFLLIVLFSMHAFCTEKTDKEHSAIATLIVSNISPGQILDLEKPLTQKEKQNLHEQLLNFLKNQNGFAPSPLPAHLVRIDHNTSKDKNNNVLRDQTFVYQVDFSPPGHHLLFLTFRRDQNNSLDISFAAQAMKNPEDEEPGFWKWAALVAILGTLFFIRTKLRKRYRQNSL